MTNRKFQRCGFYENGKFIQCVVGDDHWMFHDFVDGQENNTGGKQ